MPSIVSFVVCVAVGLASGTECRLAPQPFMPIVPSWYDPGLGGINCLEPCNRTANGTEITEAAYGRLAACPIEWIGWTVTLPELGASFLCADTGTLVRTYWSEYRGQWVIPLDILSHGPLEFDQWTVAEWKLH